MISVKGNVTVGAPYKIKGFAIGVIFVLPFNKQ